MASTSFSGRRAAGVLAMLAAAGLSACEGAAPAPPEPDPEPARREPRYSLHELAIVRRRPDWTSATVRHSWVDGRVLLRTAEPSFSLSGQLANGPFEGLYATPRDQMDEGPYAEWSLTVDEHCETRAIRGHLLACISPGETLAYSAEYVGEPPLRVSVGAAGLELRPAARIVHPMLRIAWVGGERRMSLLEAPLGEEQALPATIEAHDPEALARFSASLDALEAGPHRDALDAFVREALGSDRFARDRSWRGWPPADAIAYVLPYESRDEVGEYVFSPRPERVLRRLLVVEALPPVESLPIRITRISEAGESGRASLEGCRLEGPAVRGPVVVDLAVYFEGRDGRVRAAEAAPAPGSPGPFPHLYDCFERTALHWRIPGRLSPGSAFHLRIELEPRRGGGSRVDEGPPFASRPRRGGAPAPVRAAARARE